MGKAYNIGTYIWKHRIHITSNSYSLRVQNHTIWITKCPDVKSRIYQELLANPPCGLPWWSFQPRTAGWCFDRILPCVSRDDPQHIRMWRSNCRPGPILWCKRLQFIFACMHILLTIHRLGYVVAVWRLGFSAFVGGWVTTRVPHLNVTIATAIAKPSRKSTRECSRGGKKNPLKKRWRRFSTIRMARGASGTREHHGCVPQRLLTLEFTSCWTFRYDKISFGWNTFLMHRVLTCGLNKS